MTVNLSNSCTKDSIVDGDGLRFVIWFQGCTHNCMGCHNKNTHHTNPVKVTKLENIYKEYEKVSYHDGVTLSGGDPLLQIDAAYEMCKYFYEHDVNVWVYTGYTYEELLLMSKKNIKYKLILKYINILVDGKFVNELKSLNLLFKGSSNQRIINLPETLENNQIILYENNKIIEKKEKYLFI